jgi:hypothetical protein
MGRIKEMSLPVSSKQEGRGYFANMGDSLLRWYQFRGNLQDTKTSGADLIPLNGAVVQWLPYAGVYGLSLRPGDLYSIPDVSFALSEDKLGKGQILFRVAPFAGGIIFSGSFVLGESSADTLDLNLQYDGNDLILICAAGTEVLRRTVAVGFLGSEEFITPVINFEIEPDRFRADISLSVTDTFIGEGEIPLKASVNGNGRFRIGGKKDETKRESDPRFGVQENVSSTGETAVDAGSGTGGEDGASAPAGEGTASGKGTERESALSPETASTTAYGNSLMILDELVIMFSLEAPLRETSLTLEDGEEEPVANEEESPEEPDPETTAPEQASAEMASSGNASAGTTALEGVSTETAASGGASARTTASEGASVEKGEVERVSAAVPPDQTTAEKFIMEKPVPEGAPEKIRAKTPAPEEGELAAEGDTPLPKAREPEGDTGIGKTGETDEILEQISGDVSVRPADSVSPALFEHP